MSNLSTYYSFNVPDVNLNNQIVNWATGSPIYDASLNGAAYISSNNYKIGYGSLEMQNNALDTSSNSSSTIKSLKTVCIAVSKDQLKMVLSAVDTTLLYTTRTSTANSWSTATVIQNNTTTDISFNPLTQFYRIAITGDGSRFVTNTLLSSGSAPLTCGYIFYSNWNNTTNTYSYITKIDSTTARDYRSVTITNDGNRIIACTRNSIFLSTLVDTSYSNFIQTLETTNTGCDYLGLTVSSNGDRIVYGDINSKKWFLAFWNGTTYTVGKSIINGTLPTRNCCFNNDASLLFLTYSYTTSNITIYVYGYDNINNTYTSVSPSKDVNITTSATADAHVLYCVETPNNLYLYSGIYNSDILNTTTYNFKKDVNYCMIKSPIVDTNGLTIACWFRSNYNLNNARIFDFATANTGTSDNIRLLINNNALKFEIYKSSTNNSFNITSVNINDYSWNHIAITISYSSDTTSTIKFYINGSITTDTNINKPYPTLSSTANRVYSYLGKSNTTGDPQFCGNIDDFRIYNTVLNDTQISSLYTDTNVKNNYINSTISLLYTTPVESSSTPITPNTTLTNVGSSKTYYYWNDPYATTNAIINKSNPYNFYYTYTSIASGNAKISIVTNELVTLKLNGSIQQNLLNSGSTYSNPVTVPFVNGNNLFEFLTYNNGGQAYFAAYVTDSNNTYLFSTISEKTGWNVNITGLFSNGYPVSSLLVNNSLSATYTNATAISTATKYRSFNLDLSSNKSCKRIKLLDTNLKSNNNDLANIFFSYP